MPRTPAGTFFFSTSPRPLKSNALRQSDCSGKKASAPAAPPPARQSPDGSCLHRRNRERACAQQRQKTSEPRGGHCGEERLGSSGCRSNIPAPPLPLPLLRPTTRPPAPTGRCSPRPRQQPSPSRGCASARKAPPTAAPVLPVRAPCCQSSDPAACLSPRGPLRPRSGEGRGCSITFRFHWLRGAVNHVVPSAAAAPLAPVAVATALPISPLLSTPLASLSCAAAHQPGLGFWWWGCGGWRHLWRPPVEREGTE